MSRTLKSKPNPKPKTPPQPARRARMRLLALLVLTGLFAAAVLFVKYKLESYRAALQDRAASQVGGALGAGKIQVYGLRGLRIDDFHVSVGGEGAPRVSVHIPTVLLYVDLVDLFSGRMTIDRIQVDNSEIVIAREGDAPWFSGGAASLAGKGGGGTAGALGGWITEGLPFRVLGRGCRVRIENVSGGAALAFENVDVDVVRLPEAAELLASLAGHVRGNAEKFLRIHARYAGPEDFDLRVVSGRITADDVNVFLPAPQRAVTAGAIAPSLRLAGYPGSSLVLSLESALEGVTLRDQPAMLPPVTGQLSVLASYRLDTRLLSVTTARLEAGALAGRIEGTVDLQAGAPHLDLSLEATRLPASELLQGLLASQSFASEEIEVTLNDPYAIRLRLRGTPDAPELLAEADIGAGSFAFKPASPELPSAELKIGMVRAAWNSATGQPSGQLTIAGGTLKHALSGITAEEVSGILRVEGDRVQLEPINARVTGYPFVGNMSYDRGGGELRFDVSGTAAQIENFPPLKDVKDVGLAGAISLHARGKVSAKGAHVDIDADATQAQIAYQWWFQKPVGTGCTANAVAIEFSPGKSVQISGQVLLDTIPIHATVHLTPHKGAWKLNTIRAKTDRLDINTAGKTLRVPYGITGGTGTGVEFNWRRAGIKPDGGLLEVFTVAGHIDTVNLLPRGSDVPIQAQNANISVTVDSSSVERRTGGVIVHAERGQLPPFSKTWFLPLEPDDPALKKQYAGEPRDWTHEVSVGAVVLPPWQGNALSAKINNPSGKVEVNPFRATIENGTLEGTYLHTEPDNESALKATWTDIPAIYILRHLELPELLTGTMTGNVSYTVDQDDPASTLKGGGKFEIRDGKFSADYLAALLESRMDASLSMLPPSLVFTRLSADVVLEGDKVSTDNLMLDTPGLKLSGSGYFITDGDMNYTVKVSIAPDTAQKIPLLREAFNIQGHQLTGSSIDLTFNISGPTFRPRGQVAGLPPVGVTIVSGALQMTTEIIDLPRQILIDLFKIGGGIVGPPRQQ